MAGPVTCTVEDGVALVVVDNPPANVLSYDVLAGLESAVAEIESNPEVRAVVLASAGEKFFIGGADITEFEELLATPNGIEERTMWSRGIFARWEALRHPVLAAIQGFAAGGGTEIALLCDLIVADEGAKFGVTEVKIGLIPGGGGTQRLTRRVPVGVALELVMLGELIDAAEARRIGLVNRISPAGAARATAMELAVKLAALPAVAVQEGKLAVLEGLGLPIEQALDCEREHFLKTFASSDFREGYSAFLEKRQPVFTHA